MPFSKQLVPVFMELGERENKVGVPSLLGPWGETGRKTLGRVKAGY